MAGLTALFFYPSAVSAGGFFIGIVKPAWIRIVVPVRAER